MIKSILVKKSRINKRGVFAGRDFKKGEVVLKWKPKVLNKSEAEKLPRSLKHYIDKAGKNTYFLQQPPERFINHSCEPNTSVKDRSDVALRNIKKGEEITTKYQKGLLVGFPCHCGSKKCKGIIR